MFFYSTPTSPITHGHLRPPDELRQSWLSGKPIPFTKLGAKAVKSRGFKKLRVSRHLATDNDLLDQRFREENLKLLGGNFLKNWRVPWKFRVWGLWGKWMFWKFGNPPALKEHCSWRFLVLLRFLEQPLKLQEKQTSTSHLCGCAWDKKAGSRRWYEDLWRWPKF